MVAPSRALVALAVVAVASLPRLVHAQATDAKRAEALYDEALALTDSGKYADACPKLVESQRLDPALGTQFNLADCYEHVGKPATALQLFTEVERAARAAGKANLQGRAHARAEELTRRVPKVRVVLTRSDPGLTITIDDAAVDVAQATAGGVGVDPGAHEVSVSAPGHVAWRARVSAVDARVELARVPALAELPAATTPTVPEPTRSPTARLTSIGLAGAGIVGVGIGSIFGLIALSKRSTATERCGSDDPKQCQDAGSVPLWGEAKDAGNVSTVAFIAGGALLAAGGIVWFATAPSTARPALTGAVTPDGASLGVRALW